MSMRRLLRRGAALALAAAVGLSACGATPRGAVGVLPGAGASILSAEATGWTKTENAVTNPAAALVFNLLLLAPTWINLAQANADDGPCSFNHWCAFALFGSAAWPAPGCEQSDAGFFCMHADGVAVEE